MGRSVHVTVHALAAALAILVWYHENTSCDAGVTSSVVALASSKTPPTPAVPVTNAIATDGAVTVFTCTLRLMVLFGDATHPAAVAAHGRLEHVRQRARQQSSDSEASAWWHGRHWQRCIR